MSKLQSYLISTCVACLIASPAWAADYLTHAKTLLASGKPLAARIELQNAIKGDPKNGEAEYLLSELDLQLGDPVASEQAARAAIADGYEPEKSLTLLMSSFMAQGRYVDLLHQFTLGDATGEHGARIEVGRGDAELALQQTNEAKADFDKAVTLAPNADISWFGQYDLAASQNDLAAEQSALAHALALDPQSEQVLLRQAKLLMFQGKSADALPILKQIDGRFPSNISIKLALIHALLQTNQIDAATAQIKDVAAIVPNSVELIDDQATLDVQAQNWPAAQADLQRISPMIAQVPGALFLQALTLSHLGQMAAAEQAAQKYAAQNPNDPRGVRLLVDLELRTGHPHRALAAINAAPTSLQNDPALLMLGGLADQGIGALDQAAKNFSSVLAAAPQNVAALTALASVQMAQGQPQAAIVNLQKAIAIAPKNPEPSRLLVRAATATGQIDLAKSTLASLQASEGANAEPALAGGLDLIEMNLPAAQAAFEQMAKANPTAPGPQLELARIAALEGDPAREETLLRAVIAQSPGNQSAIEALSRLLASQGKYDDQLKLLTAAHQASPRNAELTVDLISADLAAHKTADAQDVLSGIDPSLAQNNLIVAARAAVALAAGQQPAVRAALQELIVNEPSAIGPVITLAKLDASSGDFDAARQVLDAGLSNNPHATPLLEARAGIELKPGGIDGALNEAKILASDPAHLPQALVLPGDLYLAVNQPAKAAAAFADAEQTKPSDDLLLHEIAALSASGQRAAAETKLQAALKDAPNDVALHDALGQLDIADGNLSDARVNFTAALSVDPQDEAGLNDLAWIEGKRGQPDAQPLAARAYFMNPGPQEADTLGWILHLNHQNNNAAPLLQNAHAVLPADDAITYHLAAVLAANGQKTQAIGLLKALMQHVTDKQNPDMQAAAKLLADLDPAG
jgi:putative PEP-CTERM system TPR-repeat lipoprotein